MKTIKNFLNIPIGFYMIVIQMFMLVNTAFFFPENTEMYRSMIIIFLLSYVLIYAIPDIRSKIFNTTLKQYSKKFIISFLISFITIIIIGSVVLSNKFTMVGLSIQNLNLGILILNGFIIATIEEQIFRGFFVMKFGVLIAGLLFATFHVVAYSFTLSKMLYAFIMHFLLYALQKKYKSSGVNSGLHTAINYYQMGFLNIVGG